MKTYINYRVGLFIGLFGFNILSSCVNTGRELGVCGKSGGDWRREYRQAPKAFVCKYGAIPGVVLLGLVGAGYLAYSYLGNPFNATSGPQACGFYNSTAGRYQNSTYLDSDILEGLNQYNFTRSCLEYVWNYLGLSPNATDSEGCNLYNIIAEKSNNTELLQYVADQGVDVNATC